MTIQHPQPGTRPATLADLRRRQQVEQLLRTELPRVRAAAAAWRNGLAALLGALLGFGLIKGQSDISRLTHVWAVVAGILLLAALLAGTLGALSLLQAAHGRPKVTPLQGLALGIAADHEEALRSARLLRSGITSTLICAGLLVATVATTWYGPMKDQPQLQVIMPGMSVCGSVIQVSGGMATIKTETGEIAVNLNQAQALRPVSSCAENRQ
jgi:hypothetical protein